jgi:hypothetical protein
MEVEPNRANMEAQSHDLWNKILGSRFLTPLRCTSLSAPLHISSHLFLLKYVQVALIRWNAFPHLHELVLGIQQCQPTSGAFPLHPDLTSLKPSIST